MTSLLRAEVLKQRTLRLPRAALLALTGAAVVTTTALITGAGHRGAPPLGARSLGEIANAPFALVGPAALILGVLGMAGEFRHQTITSTLLVSPRRPQLVAAKALVHAGLGAALAAAACAVSLAVAIPWLAAKHVPLALGGSHLIAVVPGSIAAAALYGALGVALGTLVSNQTAAVTIGLVWLLAVEHLLVAVTSTPNLAHWLPGGTLALLARGGASHSHPLAPWAAALLAATYTIAATGTAAHRFARRDLTAA
jgi:ABC-2 type transport system permease protein